MIPLLEIWNNGKSTPFKNIIFIKCRYTWWIAMELPTSSNRINVNDESKIHRLIATPLQRNRSIVNINGWSKKHKLIPVPILIPINNSVININDESNLHQLIPAPISTPINNSTTNINGASNKIIPTNDLINSGGQ